MKYILIAIFLIAQCGAIEFPMASEEFRQEVAEVMDFPVTRLGMCYDGAQKMGAVYDDQYNVTYAYTRGIAFSTVPGEQGHVWILVEDPAVANTWAAVDNYYGVVTDSSYYTCYRVSGNFADIEAMIPSVKLPVGYTKPMIFD